MIEAIDANNRANAYGNDYFTKVTGFKALSFTATFFIKSLC